MHAMTSPAGGTSISAHLNLGAPAHAHATHMPRTGHVTDWHFDFMENFTR